MGARSNGKGTHQLSSVCQTLGEIRASLDATESDFTTTLKPNQRLYIYAATLAFMLRSHSAGSSWNLTFKTQMRKFDLSLLAPDGTQLITPDVNMGFPVDWEELALWKPTA